VSKPFFAAVLLGVFVFASFPAQAAESYKHWRNSLKAAEQARYKREFEKMREILEGSAAEAQKLGPLSSAENAFWLAFAHRQLHQDAEALQVFDAELERIGPKPTAVKLQILRGILLTDRGVLYLQVGEQDKALASATEGKKVLEDVAGKYHPELFDAHRTIGRIHALRQEYTLAEESMRAALKLAQSRQSQTQIEGSGYEQQTVMYVSEPAPYRIIMAATDLGNVLQMQGKYDEAEKAYKTALESSRAAYPKDSVMHLRPLEGLALAELKLNRRKGFVKDTDQIYELITKNRGLGMPILNPLWLKLSADLDDQNSAGAAETIRKIANVCDIQNFDISEFGRTALSHATVNDQVDWKRAETLQGALTKTAENYRATEPAKTGLIFATIGDFASEHGKRDLAESAFDKAVQSQENAKDKSILIGALSKLAEQKIAAGKKSDALPLYHQITVAIREKYGNDSRVADAMDSEAALMKEVGQEQTAKDLQSQAMEVRKKAFLK
jgi:tetratricopeptide (TPR) repeat protein